MKMPDAWVAERLQTAMADPYSQKFAPFVLHGCILSLTGGTLPQHMLVRASLESEATEWRAAWLNSATVGFAQVRAGVEGWGSYYEASHGTVAPTKTIAWVRPLATITHVSLIAPACTLQRVHGERLWSWSAGTRLHFVDGENIDLPLFGAAGTIEEEARVAAFVDEVTSNLAGTLRHASS